MDNLNRRTFIKNFLLTTGALTLGHSRFLGFENQITDVRPFEMLTIGDSVIWGQGLTDEFKFSFLIKEWLENDVIKNQRPVNLFVAAHSGASIETKEESGFNPHETYFGEINIFTPSIPQQAEDAFHWYKSLTLPQGRDYDQRLPKHLDFYKKAPVTPANVDLILVDGGINDFELMNFVNIKVSENDIRNAARRYCRYAMKTLLSNLIGKFPNARIVVTGYFPPVSEETDPTALFKAGVEAFGENDFTKSVLKFMNIIAFPKVRPFHPIRNELAKRSLAWANASNENLRRVVEEANQSFPWDNNSNKLNKRVLVALPFPEFFDKTNAYGTKNSFVWELIADKKTNDLVYDLRTNACKDKGLEVKRGFRFVCKRAAIFHPNKKGADAYFQAIRAELKKVDIGA
jgi:lysophospholipase L1-like esterase